MKALSRILRHTVLLSGALASMATFSMAQPAGSARARGTQPG